MDRSEFLKALSEGRWSSPKTSRKVDKVKELLSVCYKCWLALQSQDLDFFERCQLVDAYYKSIRKLITTVAGNNEKIGELRRLLGDYIETFGARVRADVISVLAYMIRLLC